MHEQEIAKWLCDGRVLAHLLGLLENVRVHAVFAPREFCAALGDIGTANTVPIVLASGKV